MSQPTEESQSKSIFGNRQLKIDFDNGLPNVELAYSRIRGRKKTCIRIRQALRNRLGQTVFRNSTGNTLFRADFDQDPDDEIENSGKKQDTEFLLHSSYSF